MEILIALVGVALLAVLALRGNGAETETLPEGDTTPAPEVADPEMERIRRAYEAELARHGINADLSGDSARAIYQSYLAWDVERIRKWYAADLRQRGWPVTSLSGATSDAVYQSYLREYDRMVAERRARDLDRIRAFYLGDLQRRGWGGLTLQGNSSAVIYQNYLREFQTLLAFQQGLVRPASSSAPAAPGPDDPDFDDGSATPIFQPPPSQMPRFRIGEKVRVTRSGHTTIETISNWKLDPRFNTWFYRTEEHPFTDWPESKFQPLDTGASVKA